MGSHPGHGPVPGPVDPDVTPDDVRTSEADHALVRDRLDVLGVIAAHDRAVKLLPKRHQLTGQLPLLVAMICFTTGGLYLLFAA